MSAISDRLSDMEAESALPRLSGQYRQTVTLLLVYAALEFHFSIILRIILSLNTLRV